MTLRGDICPPWCGGEHYEDRTGYEGRPMHPEDQGKLHRRTAAEKWFPLYGADGALDDEEIDVWIEEKRYDNDPESDWLLIYANNVEPGSLSNLALHLVDARRLGEALIKACDIAEGKER